MAKQNRSSSLESSRSDLWSRVDVSVFLYGPGSFKNFLLVQTILRQNTTIGPLVYPFCAQHLMGTSIFCFSTVSTCLDYQLADGVDVDGDHPVVLQSRPSCGVPFIAVFGMDLFCHGLEQRTMQTESNRERIQQWHATSSNSKTTRGCSKVR